MEYIPCPICFNSLFEAISDGKGGQKNEKGGQTEIKVIILMQRFGLNG